MNGELPLEPLSLREEAELFYPDAENAVSRGYLGSLRGGFGESGNRFFSEWHDFGGNPKPTEDFSQILPVLIRELRKGPLADCAGMLRYCMERKDAMLSSRKIRCWGFRFLTRDYAFYLRCYPIIGETNFSLAVYDKEKLFSELARERGLPRYCYSYLRTSKEEIRVDFGERGYTPYRKQENGRAAQEMNRELGVTPAQESAMVTGSMFGWNVLAADPKNYDEKGNLIGSRKKNNQKEVR